MSSVQPTDTVRPVSSSCSYQLDPTTDARWAELVDRHPMASVFHTVGWLKALQRTYGYEPIAFTTSSPTGALKNGLVFCHVNSWLTGRRLVSLPFSDHCNFLCDSTQDLKFLIRKLQKDLEREKWRYLELRPIHGNLERASDGLAFRPSAKYFLHRLDLRRSLSDLLRSFDKDSVQRRIQRAERAGLVEKCGRSEELLIQFYALYVMTRRRHLVPPAPYLWFRNLLHGRLKALEIRVAYLERTAIAAILTLQFKNVVYYKYGCSDARFNKYGATPWLLWRAIASGKSHGADEFDMGRTQEDDTGLLAFKNRWVPDPERLVYWKYPDSAVPEPFDRWKLNVARRVFSYMPSRLQAMAGKLIYRHIA